MQPQVLVATVATALHLQLPAHPLLMLAAVAAVALFLIALEAPAAAGLVLALGLELMERQI